MKVSRALTLSEVKNVFLWNRDYAFCSNKVHFKKMTSFQNYFYPFYFAIFLLFDNEKSESRQRLVVVQFKHNLRRFALRDNDDNLVDI